MERHLPKPKDFIIDPNAPDASRVFKYWLQTVEDYIETLNELRHEEAPALNRTRIVRGFLSPEVYPYVEDATDYETIIAQLRLIYVKRKNNIYARHLLVSRKQAAGEKISEYLQALKLLAKECNFQPVTAAVYRDELVRDSFINGLVSPNIRQRLLETDNIDLQRASDLAESLEQAQIQATSMGHNATTQLVASIPCKAKPEKTVYGSDKSDAEESAAAISYQNFSRARRFQSKSRVTCYYCGGSTHNRNFCPARDLTCRNCGKQGHYAKVCRSHSARKVSSAISADEFSNHSQYLVSVNKPTQMVGAPKCLQRTVVDANILGHPVKALLDSGASENFISKSLVEKHHVPYTKELSRVTMASKLLHLQTQGLVKTTLKVQGRTYENTVLEVMPEACADIILGQKFLEVHKSVVFEFGGAENTLFVRPPEQEKSLCLAAAQVDAPHVFEFLQPNCRPIATRSRSYSKEDQIFIKDEIQQLLSDKIIEPSRSPWRAQVLVVRNPLKWRLVIDYSQTVNRFTLLDAYPLPKIEDIVNQVATDRFYSSLDLKSAYHQVPLLKKERPLTAFEALGRLYQYKRLPFGVSNGASAFQRVIDDVIQRHQLKKVYAYLDDLTVTGSTLEEHDQNLRQLLAAAAQSGLTFNEKKSKIRQEKIQLLGHEISQGSVKPDPDRLKPLLQMQPPESPKELKRVSGMFAYYAKWIDNFSFKARPLLKTENFPLNNEALQSFQLLKQELANASLGCICEDVPFTVESDASDYAVAAVLSQAGRPVAFMSRTLNASERRYPAIEKEATAIIEAVRKWTHFLKARMFTLVTDQRSLSFMFDKSNRGKIKNNKIMLWRLELSQYHYEIRHKPGKENIASDALSRMCSTVNTTDSLKELHFSLGHPGFTRMYHFIRVRNLPYTSEETKRVCQMCTTCAEIKPRFHRPESQVLVKALNPWERLSMDFKGPVKGPRSYLFIVVDEYSRYPFAFPCKNMTSQTVIDCLSTLFCLFGFPKYIHSDRATSFLSKELKHFLTQRGIATSCSSPYHPQGNAQCERINQTIWKTVKLLLQSTHASEDQWERVLPKALHAIRSLLCTATNQTPHERMFSFPRRAISGTAMPSWLLDQNTQVLLRRFVRNKGDPLCDPVELLMANPTYAKIRYADGRESTVSTSDLAPYPNVTPEPTVTFPPDETANELLPQTNTSPPPEDENESVNKNAADLNGSQSEVSSQPEPRRSNRLRRPPQRYGY